MKITTIYKLHKLEIIYKRKDILKFQAWLSSAWVKRWCT